MVEIHDRIVLPKLALDFLAGHDFAPALNQHSQDLEGLLPQEDFAFAVDRARRTQFPRLNVKLKPPEPDATWDRLFHETCEIG